MTLRLVLHCKLKDEDGFKAISQELPASVEANEPETLDYRWFRHGSNVILFDDYASPEAFVKHFQMNKENGLLDRCMEALQIESVHALGEVSPQASAILAELGATAYEQVAGFQRTPATATH